MRLRGLLLAGAVTMLAGVAALQLPGAGDADADPVATSIERATANVERRDLVEREELGGTLGYGDPRPITFGGDGTVTGLAGEGTEVRRGGRLGEIDGRPVTLFYGERPLWRALGDGVTDGEDVHQVEDNLVALGHGTAASLGPDDEWSPATTRAVQRWQDQLGVEETGRVEPGWLVYAPGPVRVADHLAAPGAPAGAPALSLTGTERLVTVDLPVTSSGLLTPAQAVEVELPGGALVPATVRSVSSVVTPADPQQGSGPTIPVTIVLDEQGAGTGLVGAPVDVHVVSVAAADVLAVPVEALLALAEGGYAVERPDGTLIGVELGAAADGWVEIRPAGDLVEGDPVVVPA